MTWEPIWRGGSRKFMEQLRNEGIAVAAAEGHHHAA
jgi:hypothetical protein